MTLDRMRSVYLGALLLVCLMVGGGTQKGLPTAFALELLTLPLALDSHRPPDRSNACRLVTEENSFRAISQSPQGRTSP